ncbi:MAG TPA: hypothetical protein VNE82_09715, partial [Candidatus Binataceae bacterium]|nr:hypothetical protein [Candidatus Binataceae bacterium]
NTSRGSSSTSIGTWWQRATAPSIATNKSRATRKELNLGAPLHHAAHEFQDVVSCTVRRQGHEIV